ncbi:FAS1 domain-containing protein [Backusella circina FSU 941]|nr:FAS1 domain-containing protein [Backusella circina FSU 941]
MRLLYIFLLLVTLVVAAEKKSLYELLIEDDRFTTFMSLVKERDLHKLLKDAQKGTVFVPVNDAFNEKSIFFKSTKYSDEQLKYHLLADTYYTAALVDGKLLETESEVNGNYQLVKITTDIKNYFVGDAKVIDKDLKATNGVVHAIDKILTLPANLGETLSSEADFHDFASKSIQAGVYPDLKKTTKGTIFLAKGAVYDDQLSWIEKSYLDKDAGKKDLGRLLGHQITLETYYATDFKEGKSHIKTAEGSEDLEIEVKKVGSDITVNGIKVIAHDILASNGVIHVLEEPLLPNDVSSFLKMNTRKTLVGINATRFADLFDSNGLGGYLDKNNNEAITLLAPPNDAFTNAYISDIEGWLRYHIVKGAYNESDLIDGQLLETESHDRLGKSFNQRLQVHITDQHESGNDYFINKRSIQFGKSGTLGSAVSVNDHVIIYPISRALELPRDPLNQLPSNLDLSTFVASLYASESNDDIEEAQSITIFAPTNDAFSRLGLLSKCLLQPEYKHKLQQVVKYHAVRGLFYQNSTAEGEHREVTLAGPEINLNKTKDGLYLRGAGAGDGNDRSVIAKVIDADTLTSNGLIHTIDRVQVPSDLEISNRDLLSTEGTTTLLTLLKKTNLTHEVLDDLDKHYTILAPNDRAFAKLNMTRLLDDRERLLKIARLHIIPSAFPRLEWSSWKPVDQFKDKKKKEGDDEKSHEEIGYTGVDFPTMLDDDSYVVITKSIAGGYSVKVKGSDQESADVVQYGRDSSGGGVIEIDRVLIPIEIQEHHGWPWWAIVLTVIGGFVGAAVLAVAIYAAYQWYQKRQGGISLGSDD